MARPYRLQAENCFYHITSRGNDGKNIFLEKNDYKKFLEYIASAKIRYRFYLYAYVLMTNHYHLLIETAEANLSRIMHNINSSYTTYHSVKYKKRGHFLQGRFKSIVVEKQSYFLEVSRYIHLNPVRANMVVKPEDYPWSSYCAYTGKSGENFIDKDKIQEAMGMDITGYKAFVEDGINIHINPFKEVCGGFLLGNANFVEDKLDELRNQIEGLNEISHKNIFNKKITAEDVISRVEKKYGKPIKDICSSKIRPNNEKKMLIYLMRKLTDLTNKQIGKIMGLKYQAVSMAYSNVEFDLRKNRELQKEADELVCSFEV